MRTERWKYCITQGDVDELYDLDSDPNEIQNLAGDPQYAKIVAEHQRYLLDWMVETEDTMVNQAK